MEVDAAGDLLGVVLGVVFPAADDAIAIQRVVFTNVGPAPGLVAGDQGRAAAAKQIQYDSASWAGVLDGVRHELHRLDGGMQRKLVEASGLQGVDTLVLPDI